MDKDLTIVLSVAVGDGEFVKESSESSEPSWHEFRFFDLHKPNNKSGAYLTMINELRIFNTSKIKYQSSH